MKKKTSKQKKQKCRKKAPILITTFLLFLATLLITSCAQNTNTSNTTNTTNHQVVNIGVIAAQTSPVATISIPSQRAIQLAQDDWNNNKHHKTKFNVIFEDNQGKPNPTINAFHKLTSQDNAAAIITDISMTTMTLAEAADTSKTPLVAYLSTSPSVRGAGDYVYRTVPMNIVGITLMSDHLLKNKRNNVAVLTEIYDYPIALKEIFEEDFKNKGGTILVSETFEASEDLRSTITKATKQSPNAIIIFVQTPPTGLQVLTQIKELNIDLPIYGNEIFTSDMILRIGDKQLLEGIIAGLPVYNKEKTNQLQQKYLQKYEDDTLDWLYVATAYDAAWTLFETIETVGVNKEKIKQHLDTTYHQEGYSGTITFDEEGDVKEGNYALFHVKGGKKLALS